MRRVTRTAIAATLSVLAVSAATGAAGAEMASGTEPGPAAESAQGARIVGSGGARLPDPSGNGDPVWFKVDGRMSPEGQHSGRFHVIHRTPDGGPFAEFEGRIDCVFAVEGQGVVTGIIEKVDAPALPPDVDLMGRRVGVSIKDNRHGPDAIGWSWSTGGFEQDTLPCNSVPPFLDIEHGGYHVSGSMFG
ncbi:hypothetical protein BAY61_22000 [Prauserella marina]|uniref:Uncharacterized protein n=1 Tax=Prauserella marina TaxID=530584 RepID=A0A222W070_9PSEU|nr:hypothetical protein [Prauserella marina]ASR39540.1 hypothetical protein BAY61_22000 [Prauserella marina]PWV72547.1 hypothetical protein DES30_110146 [Prauserella marina]SDD77480.1 hypothetical protein SAMN05421630_11292 [Prauserella marina]